MRVVADLRRRSFGDLAAVVEDDDVVGDAHHHAHVVLDQQQSDALPLPDRQEEMVEFRRLSRVQARGRLVEAEQHRIDAHGPRDLGAPLLAVGERRRWLVGPCRQLHAVEPVAGEIDRRAFRLAVAAEAEEAADRPLRGVHQLVVLGDDQVFEDGHRRKQADVLKRPGDARPLGDAEAVHLLEEKAAALGMFEGEPANRRFVEPGQAVEDGRLAGAVGADDGGDRAGFGHERRIVDGDEATEPHRQVFDGEERRRRRSVGPGRRPALTRAPREARLGPVRWRRLVAHPDGRRAESHQARRPDHHDQHHQPAERQHPEFGEAAHQFRAADEDEAAMTTPIWLPMPPRTTMARMIADSMNEKLSGLMKP